MIESLRTAIIPEAESNAPNGRGKEFNKVTQGRLLRFLEDHPEVSLTLLAKQIGYSPATLSNYRSGKPEGDVPKLEALLEDAMKAYVMRSKLTVELFENDVSRIMNGAFETVRKTGDMGGLFGGGGVGKTCGTLMYIKANPTAILVTAAEWSGSGTHMRRAIWDQVDTRGWDSQAGSQAAWLVKRFKNSDRLFIVDECHELKKTGRKFWRHFHDQTGCPICFVGNEEFLERIADDPQFFSRLGYVKTLKPDTSEEMARAIVEKMAPGAWEEIGDLARVVNGNSGHGRALRKQIALALEIKGKTKADLRTCFKSAHTNLVRSYALKA